jgi:hypothetical protein
MEARVKYADWMGDSGGDDVHDWEAVFNKDKFDKGGKGHMLLQLQKTYKGDERFRLDKDDFALNLEKDKGHGKVSLPDTMLGALSKREREALDLTGKKRRRSSDFVVEA